MRDREISDRSPLCDSHREEVASVVTHAVGVVLSVAALVTMLMLAGGERWKVVSAAVFGGRYERKITNATPMARIKPPDTPNSIIA